MGFLLIQGFAASGCLCGDSGQGLVAELLFHVFVFTNVKEDSGSGTIVRFPASCVSQDEMSILQ